MATASFTAADIADLRARLAQFRAWRKTRDRSAYADDNLVAVTVHLATLEMMLGEEIRAQAHIEQLGLIGTS